MCYIFSVFSENKYEYVNNLRDSLSYSYFLIGGAGNGKSTMMKKIANRFSDRQITYLFCSFDNTSLDGIIIDNKIMVFDATYPHNILPTMYKINGEVVDIGKAVDKSIGEISSDILSIVKDEKKIKQQYISSGNILRQYLMDKYNNITKQGVNMQNLHDKVDNLLLSSNNDILTDVYLYNMPNKKCYSIKGDRLLSCAYLEGISKYLTENNIRHTKYRNLYCEDIIEGIATEDKYVEINAVDSEILFEIDEKNDYYEWCDLLQKAKYTQKNAVKIHKQLENCYRKYIDFGVVDTITNDLILDISKRL